MSNYDFKQLSPHDLEQLARDLIQARDNITLESFKAGRDQGIDFRHAHAKGNLIVQCKHYVGTGLVGLMADLKKEAVKVSKLKPNRYMLVTSVGLTPRNKTDIQALFSAVLSTSDILGADDLNNLLGQYPAIEHKHYKLWLTSRVMLDRVIHNASLVQSEFEVERVYRDIRRYVGSAAFTRALSMLDGKEHFTIISGAPGVGKTSLAKMLLYVHLQRGYEVISILTDFQTGRERYQRGKKQIFYFDDFIGATFLGERASTFTRNEDRAILDFIQMVKDSPTAKLVLTTREHILRQAIETSEKLKHSNVISSRCVLEIGDYNKKQRAEILYNHIYFSELSDGYREILLAERFYMEIVKHKKFNPRLIDWLSTFQRVKSIPLGSYQSFVRRLLADPSEIWRHAYERQISDGARSVLLALYTYNGKCGPALLERTFWASHALRAQRYGFKSEPSDWRRALNEINGSFIRPGNQIEVIDPSVLDMLNAVIRQDTINALDMIESAIRFEQVRRIWVFSVARNSHDVLNLFANEPARVAAAFERSLAAPNKRVNGNSVVYFDDSPEIRVGTVIDAATTLQSEQLYKLAVFAVDRLLTNWQSEPVNIGDGAALLQKIDSAPHIFPTSKNCLRSCMLGLLASAASRGCRSGELCALLNNIASKDLDENLSTLLNTAAQFFLEDYFMDELNECEDLSELTSLKNNLSLIARHTNIDPYSPIYSVDELIFGLEYQQEAQQNGMFEQLQETQYKELSGDDSIHDLFDSLRNY